MSFDCDYHIYHFCMNCIFLNWVSNLWNCYSTMKADAIEKLSSINISFRFSDKFGEGYTKWMISKAWSFLFCYSSNSTLSYLTFMVFLTKKGIIWMRHAYFKNSMAFPPWLIHSTAIPGGGRLPQRLYVLINFPGTVSSLKFSGWKGWWLIIFLVSVERSEHLFAISTHSSDFVKFVGTVQIHFSQTISNGINFWIEWMSLGVLSTLVKKFSMC